MTAEQVYESLPQSITFADLQRAGGPRATAARRWLRDNVPAYLARSQNRTVLDKKRDQELIMLLLSRVGSGGRSGFAVPNADDNAAILADLAKVSGTPASAASVQGPARAESQGEADARKRADAENKRVGARS